MYEVCTFLGPQAVKHGMNPVTVCVVGQESMGPGMVNHFVVGGVREQLGRGETQSGCHMELVYVKHEGAFRLEEPPPDSIIVATGAIVRSGESVIGEALRAAVPWSRYGKTCMTVCRCMMK